LILEIATISEIDAEMVRAKAVAAGGPVTGI
jgi:hypothetical protein